MQQVTIPIRPEVTLHAEVGGNPNNPCLLLVMGLGGQMIHWSEKFCLAMIDQGFYVVRFDNRDIGLSTKTRTKVQSKSILPKMIRFQVGLKNSGAAYTLEDMADDCALLIDHLQIKKCHVIGASMGGMIAQILAAKYPEKIERLGLLFTSNNRPFLPPPRFKQLSALLKRSKSDKPEHIIEQNVKVYQIIGSPNYINLQDTRKIAQIAYDRSYTPMGVLQQFLAILCTGSLLHWDKQIKQQTLVVHGNCDRLLPPSHGKAVAKAIQDAKFELITGMGHDISPHFIPRLSGLFGHHFKT